MKEFLLENGGYISDALGILAAVSGTVYLKKTKYRKLSVFVYYLWLTVAVEFIGGYTYLMQRNYDYEWFISIKNSVFCYNMWFFNIYNFLTIGLLGIFYSDLLISKSLKIIVRSVFLIYSVFTLAYYIFTDAFFTMGLPFEDILATVIVTIYVICYFIELIRSEYILQYYKMPSFYISVALLSWQLIVTPLIIFNGFFRAVNTEFVTFRTLFFICINTLTYLCIVFGFWYSLYKNKQ